MAENKNCIRCGKQFRVKGKKATAIAKYCSLRCKGLSERVRGTANCGICGKLFEFISCRCNTAKYCSRKCYYKSLKGKGSVETSCRHCGKVYRTSPSKCHHRIFCSIACRVADHNKRHPLHSHKHPSALRKAMNKRGLIARCEVCGYDEEPKILGVHHKDRNNRNSEATNLQIVCPNCHSKIHLKHIVHAVVQS